jgi:diacylglycerol O-acyltransferase / trehalose O-mycolyltransferase
MTWRLRKSSGALRRWLWSGGVLLAAACMVGCGTPSSSPTPAGTLPPASASPSGPPTHTVAGSARIVEAKTLSSRSTDLKIESPAVGGLVQVRLLLPVSFQAESERRWPVLYLLHGCCDTYVSWTRSTDIEQLTRKHDFLVVMPDGGKAGFYSNWRTGPQWETFHTQELPQLLVSQYRANGKAAIAGVSMGGLGAFGYAARHPGSYTAAASFSGIVHTRLSSDVSRGYLGLVSSQGAADPLALWGDPDTDAETWKQHNPYDLAPQLKSIPLFISAGDGQAGPLDDGGVAPDSIESSINAQNKEFVKHLRKIGANAEIDLYGHGTHNWVYWQRELHRAWPLLTNKLESS